MSINATLSTYDKNWGSKLWIKMIWKRHEALSDGVIMPNSMEFRPIEVQQLLSQYTQFNLMSWLELQAWLKLEIHVLSETASSQLELWSQFVFPAFLELDVGWNQISSIYD